MAAARRTVTEGIIVGLIGYASVALFYSVFDFLAARGTLYTVDLLGKAVFRGLRDPGVLRFPLAIDTGAIFSYNALHLVLALAIGLIVTALVAHADEHPSHSRAVTFVIVAGFVVTIAAAGLLSAPIRPLLPWWSIIVANALATLLAASYFAVRRPGLSRRLALIA